jgi:hypothetical protein
MTIVIAGFTWRNAVSAGFLLLDRSTAAAGAESNDDQQNHGSDQGRYQRADNSATKVQAKHATQPAANESADDTHDDVDNDSEASSVDDSASERTGNSTDDEPKNDSV